MTAGGLTAEGKWKNVDFIPYDVMHRKWQHHLLDLLRQEVQDSGVPKDIDRGWKTTPKASWLICSRETCRLAERD